MPSAQARERQHIDAWGGRLYLLSPRADVLAEFLDSYGDDNTTLDNVRGMARLITLCAIRGPDSDSLLFEPGDVEWLITKDFGDLTRISDVCNAICGSGNDEDLEKNLSSATAGASNTA